MSSSDFLVRYGIYDDKADLRLHVCVQAKSIYIFTPTNVQSILEAGYYDLKEVHTGAKLTARGYVVPPDDIPGCRRIPIPEIYLQQAAFSARDSTSTKGYKAEQLVKAMIADNLLPLILYAVEINDLDMQRSGSDIVINNAQEISIKCDWAGGNRELGGTGHLFIQTEESNPLKSYSSLPESHADIATPSQLLTICPTCSSDAIYAFEYEPDSHWLYYVHCYACGHIEQPSRKR